MPGERIVFGAAALPEPDRDWLAAVEQLPIESVWQGGHLLPRSGTGEAITRLALMTAWTERVRVGTAILLLPLYHPVVVAKQVADLDSRSGGRLTLGVGVGGEFPKEFEAVGVPVSERGARTDESIEILRALWSGEPTTVHGKFFDVSDVQLQPVDVPGTTSPAMQAGGPPIVVSGRKGPAMRRAARLGDGWMPYLLSPDAYAADRRHDHRGGGVDRTRPRRVRMGAVPLLRDPARRGPGRGRRSAPSSAVPTATSPTRCSTGSRRPDTPDEVAARIQAYVDAGVRHIVISPAVPTDTLEVITLAANEVLPRLSLPSSGGAS